jgi:chromosome segregation ATPase
VVGVIYSPNHQTSRWWRLLSHGAPDCLEGKIKDHEAALEKKDFVIQTMEGSLAEVQAEIARLNSELSTNSKNFEQEKKDFDAKLDAKVAKSSNLQKSLKELQDKCLNFGNRCVQ